MKPHSTEIVSVADKRLMTVKKLSMEQVYEAVLAQFPCADKKALESRSCKRTVTEIRHILFYFCYIFTSHSQEEIGLRFGRRDHSSVFHGYTNVNNDYYYKPEYRDDVLIPIERKLMELAGMISFIKPEYIDQLVQMDDDQHAIIQRMTLDFINASKVDELDALLHERDHLSVGAARLYHSRFSLSEFAQGLRTAYEQHMFSLFALEHLFPQTYRDILPTYLNDYPYKGSTFIAIYRAYKNAGVEVYYLAKDEAMLA